MENPSRRRVLAAGLAGTALGLVDRRVASAGSTPPSPAPVTAEPEAQPTAEDAGLLAAAREAELASRDLYQLAIDAGAGGGDGTMEALRDDHAAYADVLSGLIGRDATQSRDEELFESLSAGFDSDDTAGVAAAAYDMESTLVATHSALLGQLKGRNGAKTIASILMVEARHCVVLADVAGLGDDLDALFVNDAEPRALTPVEG
ncbi:MAG: ferritin-like domain-containing protein [Acidimicrobiia bacterium]|nr:ferritin-like domain-containing protein [Acidimicrobiia bacterium]